MIITKNYFSTFLRLVLCCFVIILFMNLLSSSSYAYSFDDFKIYISETYNNQEQPANFSKQCQTFLQPAVTTLIENDSWVATYMPNITTRTDLSFILYKDSDGNTSNYFDLVVIQNDNCNCLIENLSPKKITLSNITGCSYAIRFSISYYNGSYIFTQKTNMKNSSFNSYFVARNYMSGLIQSDNFTNNTSLIFSNTWSQVQPVAFEVYPLDESLQDGKEVVRLQYRQKDLYLGHFINLDNVDLLEYTLSFNNGTWSEHGYTEFNNNNYNGNQNIYMSGDSVYVKSLLLNYYNTYEFNWGAWESDSLLNQGTLYYYVLPINAVVSGGVIVSSGDADPYSTQDQTIDILGDLNDSSNVSFEIDSFVSGDFAATLGYETFEFSGDRNGYFIIYNFVDQICDVLLSSGDVYWDVSVHGEQPTRIYASDFTTPNGMLKSFISSSMVFGALFLLYLQLKDVVELVQQGRAPKVLQLEDADCYFYKM